MPARSSPPPHGVIIPPFPSLTREATACIEVYADEIEIDIVFDDAEDEDRLSLARLVQQSLFVEAPSPPPAVPTPSRRPVPKTASGSMTGPRNYARRMMLAIAVGAAFVAGSASAFLAAPRGGAQAAMAPPAAAAVAKQASDDATVAVPVTVRAAPAAAAPGEAHATKLPGMGTKPTRGAARTTTTATAPDSPPACREGLVSELPRSHGHTMVAVRSYERCVDVQPLFRPWSLPSASR